MNQSVKKHGVFFEVVRDALAPVPVGGIVEFAAWSEMIPGSIEGAQVAQHGPCYPIGTRWSYGPKHLRPLTEPARVIHRQMKAARKAARS